MLSLTTFVTIAQITFDPKELVGYLLGPLGTLFLTLFILYAGYKKWWVFGWYASELKNRNDRLENRIDEVSNAARGVTSIAKKAIEKAEVTSE
jgi:hypothetical protein